MWQWLDNIGAKNRQRLGGPHVKWLDGNGFDWVRLEDGELYFQGGRPVKLRNFCAELVFHGDCMSSNSIKQVYYRTHDGKVVLDLAQVDGVPRYHLSFRRGSAKSGEWTSAKCYMELPGTDELDEMLEDLGEDYAAQSTDFWIAEESI
ncbi:hypothetical protein Slin15195_G085100 [Septoria linicola]|uniref:Uncharacterized protein n=1 Tax=Septoria linicola TaxID=215465 RepID=A0A9Q9B0R2_9PEZI|nr:hypothetical protein Slin15195_G085100 [Septoria linicola]